MKAEFEGEIGKPGHETFGGQKDGVQPPIVAVHPTDAARTPREIQVREPGREWTMTVRPPTVVAEMRDDVPQRALYGVEENTYFELESKPLHVIHAQREGEKEAEIIVVGPPVTAREISSLLFFSAPDRNTSYKLDTADVIDDWEKIGADTEEAQKLRDAHETMPGFLDFLDQRGQILDVLKRNYKPTPLRSFSDGMNFLNEDPEDVLIPVVRIGTDDEGNDQIVLTALDEELRTAIAQALPEQFPDQDTAERMNTAMGLLYVTTYSPEHSQWDAADTIVKQREEERVRRNGKLQSMGPAQVPGLIYRNIALQQQGSDTIVPKEDIQASPLVENLAAYARTGHVYRKPDKIPVALPDYPKQDLRTMQNPPTYTDELEELAQVIANYKKEDFIDMEEEQDDKPTQ